MTLSGTGKVIVHRLEDGTDLYQEISNLAERHSISSGRVTGSGSVRQARIVTYDQKTMQHVSVEIHSQMEIVSLYGEVLITQGQPTASIHIVLADNKGNGYGGQLTHGTTPAISCEICIEETANPRRPIKGF